MFRAAPIIGVGRFADNRYQPISTLVSADCRFWNQYSAQPQLSSPT